MPKDFENHFRGASPPAVGWFSAFTRYLAEQVKDNERFRNILVADLLVDLTQLGLATQDIVRALDATVSQIAAGLNRIETKIGVELSEFRQTAEVWQRETTDKLAAYKEEILAAVALAKGVDPEHLRPIVARLGHTNTPLVDIPRVLGDAVDALIARAGALTLIHNDGAAIDEAIQQASSPRIGAPISSFAIWKRCCWSATKNKRSSSADKAT